MTRRETAKLHLAVTTLGVAAWLLAAPPATAAAAAAPSPGGHGDDGKGFLSTDFAACGQAPQVNPQPVPLTAGLLDKTLHGVWAGHRVDRDGKPFLAHFGLIIDIDAHQGIAYEERGPAVTENLFGRFFPKAGDSAPHLIYFYCGGEVFKPFKDIFVKVSDDPREGLEALQTITGVQTGSDSLLRAWTALVDADLFAQDRGGNVINAAYYTISVVEQQRPGDSAGGVRWDMVGQYRGSPAKYLQGQPVPGLEGGYFEGVGDGPGDAFGISLNMYAACYCDPTRVKWDTPVPLTNMGYTKLVIGPLSR